MKYFFYVSLLFFASNCFGQNKKKTTNATQFSPNEKNAIIGKPIQFEGIELAQFGFSKEMTFIQAKEACKKLGNGWRLPNWDEMNVILRYSQQKNLYKESHYILGDSFTAEETRNKIYPIVEIDATFYDPEGNFRYVDEKRTNLDVFYVWPVRNILKLKNKR
jgi:hypothetical protein